MFNMEERSRSGPAVDFEAHLAREVLESERLRMAILAALFGVVTALMLLVPAIFHEHSALGPWTTTHALALAVTVGLIAYELAVRYALGRMLARGTMPPAMLRFVNAGIETSVPSLLIVLLAREVEPIVVLQGPAAYLYAMFIILATLRLDFTLCAFTGTVAAIEFAALSFAYVGDFDYTATAGVMSTPGFILGKAALLFLSGVVAGLVAKQLRRRISRAFRAVQERERVIDAFGQQVSPQIVDELLKQGPEIASRRSFVCVMFMDIRDFTAYAERRSPEEIVALQNAVFGVAIEIVNRHHGVINQFLGDGFMATFGAPLSAGNDCANALAAARELVSRITQVKIGIGLHAGDAVTGNVGSPERKQYSVTGNVVILASRVEQLNKEYGSQLLVSHEVLERSPAPDAIALGPVRVKGREQPIEIFRVL